MKKLFSFLAAALLTLSANATIREITPTHCFEGERTDGYTLYVELARGAQAGDTIMLADGTYLEGQSIPVNNDVTIMAAEDAHPVVQMSGYFQIHASAIFKGIKFKSVAAAGSGYCTYFYDNSHKYVKFEDCEFQDFMDYVASSWEQYHIDSCIVNNCYFHDLGKAPFYFVASSLENGVNACDNLTVTNSTFANITLNQVAVLDLRNNGSSTAATSKLRVDHCTFYNCKGYERMIQSYKSPDVVITNCIMMNPLEESEEPAIYATYLYGGSVHHNLNYQTKRQYGSGVTVTDSICRDPQFVDAANADYTLGENSPALGAGTEGSNLGDPRWWPVAAPAVEDGFYIIYADWNLESLGAKLAVNPEAQDGADEMFVSFNLPEGFALKVVEVANGNIVGWYPDGYGTEYVADAAHSGDVVLYFRKNYDGDSNYWYSGCIYIGVPAEPDYFAYNVSEVIEKNVETAATGGSILFGADKFETPAAVGVLGYKLDGNASETNSKYALCKLDRPLAADDIISISGYATSNPKAGQAFQVSLDRAGSQVVGTAATTVANAVEILNIPVSAEAVGATAFYITRVSASVYLTAVQVHAADVPTAVENAPAAIKARKVLENGRVLIIRDGIRYTVLGQRQ